MNYIFDGNELVLIINEINRIIEKNKYRSTDIFRYDGSEKKFIDNFESFINELNMPPFLSDKKMVILRNPSFLKASNRTASKKDDDNSKGSSLMDSLIEYINNSIEEIDFVIYSDEFNITKTFLGKKLDKKNYIYKNFSKSKDFYYESGNIIDSYNLDIDNNARKLLLEYSNSSISELILNLNKLALYPDKIDVSVIKGLCDRSIEDNMFNLTNAFFSKDVEKTIKVVRDFKALSINLQIIIATFASQLRFYNLVQYYQNKNTSTNEIVKITKAKEYRIRLVSDSLRRFRNTNFLHVLNELALFDQKIKSSNAYDKYEQFELFLIKLIGEYYAGN